MIDASIFIASLATAYALGVASMGMAAQIASRRESVAKDELLLTERYLADENAALKKTLATALVRGANGRFKKWGN